MWRSREAAGHLTFAFQKPVLTVWTEVLDAASLLDAEPEPDEPVLDAVPLAPLPEFEALVLDTMAALEETAFPPQEPSHFSYSSTPVIRLQPALRRVSAERHQKGRFDAVGRAT